MWLISHIVPAPSQGTRLPDPGTDQIAIAFYSYFDSEYQRVDHGDPFRCKTGIIALRDAYVIQERLRDWKIDIADTELELINTLVDTVNELDPDILTGWEVQSASWGFLAARAATYGENKSGFSISRPDILCCRTGCW